MPLMRFSTCGGTHWVLAISRNAVSRSEMPKPSIGLSIAMNHCGVLR